MKIAKDKHHCIEIYALVSEALKMPFDLFWVAFKEEGKSGFTFFKKGPYAGTYYLPEQIISGANKVIHVGMRKNDFRRIFEVKEVGPNFLDIEEKNHS